jgi:hypothetical protein
VVDCSLVVSLNTVDILVHDGDLFVAGELYRLGDVWVSSTPPRPGQLLHRALFVAALLCEASAAG